MVSRSWLVRRSWLLVSLLLLAIVTYGSLTPTLLVPQVVGYDKARHFLGYGAIALPIALVRPRRWGWMLLGILAWSIGIELVQPLVGRSRDIDDFLANTAGASLAVLASLLLRKAATTARALPGLSGDIQPDGLVRRLRYRVDSRI